MGDCSECYKNHWAEPWMRDVRDGCILAFLKERASLLPSAYSSPSGHLGRRSYCKTMSNCEAKSNFPSIGNANHQFRHHCWANKTKFIEKDGHFLERLGSMLSNTYHHIFWFISRWGWIKSSHPKVLKTSPSNHNTFQRNRVSYTIIL